MGTWVHMHHMMHSAGMRMVYSCMYNSLALPIGKVCAGYVRIAPATLASISSGETPRVRTHISAIGFSLNEDWADVSRSQGDS